MPGDYSRRLFRRGKHYSGVLMQQGRVQLDADFNEQLDIGLYRTETEAIDVIGRCGVPRHNGGFLIGAGPNNQDLTISAGRIYVDGLLCELESGSSYVTQPHLPNPDNTSPVTSPPASPPNRRLSLQDGRYIVYLDAWQQERSALDDPLIREVALGGPDTTARLQNIWQVKLLRLTRDVPASSPPVGNFTCRTQFPEYVDLTAPSTGTLNAQTAPPQPEEDPCLLPPTSGYSRLENQLYRIEIQNGGTLTGQGGPVTFKWSRDNASVQTSVISIADDVATVQDTGRDELLSFSNNQWVELYDEESTLKAAPRALVQIDKVQPATREITFKSSLASFSNRLPGLKLRRWDQSDNANQNGLQATPNQWIDVEAGVQVSFSPGTYRPGDYWLIPARTATREIEWPPFRIPNTQPEQQPPRGVRHHFCRLALLEVVNGQLRLRDCRQIFPPLTELVDFFYVGGAGQQAAVGDRLPCPLEVGVTNGRLPVAGARVRFTVPQAGGTLFAGGNSGTTLIVESDADGVAAVQWQLGQLTASQRCLRVEATLLDEDGTEFAPSLHFNANITTGAEEPGITVRQIVTPDDNNPLRNDTLVAVTRLRRGILITCDQPIAPNIGGNSPDPASFRETAVEAKPTCYVTLDLPWPIGADTNLWDTNSIFGFQPIVLAARVAVNDRQILWNLTRETQAWLQNTLFTVLRRQQIVDRVLCRLTLKGNFIFAPNNANLNLDGEAFGRPRGDDRIDLQLPSGDNRRGGDLEMWFWLTPAEVPPVTGLNLTATVTPAPAGTALGTIRGTLVDSNGAVVPGTVINLFGQIGTRTVTTDASGVFTFPNLPRGTYRVSVQVGNLTAEQNLIVT
ncbi:MAG TPA: DUF6519 domain-containing protein [Pyrinomonadaceae bacterium]